jgi:hypothetical protein
MSISSLFLSLRCKSRLRGSIMNSNNNLTVLLRTIKNGTPYHIYGRKALPFDLSDNFITFSIRTIECLDPEIIIYPQILSRIPTYDGYECIQIVASKGKFKTTKFLYWAESKDFITCTAIIPSGSYIFPLFRAQTYGAFLDNIAGPIPSITTLRGLCSNMRLASLMMIPANIKAQLALPV